MSAPLPAPVARYLRQCVPAGASQIRAARLAQAGELRTGVSSDRWMRFSALQRVWPLEDAFAWDARVEVAPLVRVRVRDALRGGAGSGRVDLWSWIPLAADRDRAELNAGALHRFLAEAAWYPTRLRPGGSLSWSPIDERRALATLRGRRSAVSLEFHFNAADEIAGVYTSARWGRFGSAYRQAPWEGRFADYREVDSMRVPGAGEAGWYAEGNWQAVWKGRVEQFSYETA